MYIQPAESMAHMYMCPGLTTWDLATYVGAHSGENWLHRVRWMGEEGQSDVYAALIFEIWKKIHKKPKLNKCNKTTPLEFI